MLAASEIINIKLYFLVLSPMIPHKGITQTPSINEIAVMRPICDPFNPMLCSK